MNQKNEALWKIFRDQGITQTEFAKKVKMNRTTNISLWLSGQQDISFEKLENIAEHLGYKLNINLEKKRL